MQWERDREQTSLSSYHWLQFAFSRLSTKERARKSCDLIKSRLNYSCHFIVMRAWAQRHGLYPSSFLSLPSYLVLQLHSVFWDAVCTKKSLYKILFYRGSFRPQWQLALLRHIPATYQGFPWASESTHGDLIEGPKLHFITYSREMTKMTTL